MLQSVQRKMLDLLNSVGLSDSLLRVIERRQRMDKWITYGGMILVSCLLIALWWWLRS
jgi:Golgi SNAP receptor complex protein 2